MAERVGPQRLGRWPPTSISRGWPPDAGHAFEVTAPRRAASIEPPPGPFDLIHARLVLVHVPRRREALAAMVELLRPGGWLVVEDADPALQPLTCIDEYGPEQALANRAAP